MTLVQRLALAVDQHVKENPDTTVNVVRAALREVDSTVVRIMVHGHQARTLH